MILGKDDQRQNIRAVFLHRQESYCLGDVARLTGFPPAKLRREVRMGWRDASKVNGSWQFTWRQLVFVALSEWTLGEILDALGSEAEAVLPPLLTLRTVTVRLPEFILRALEMTAADHGMTLDDALHGELIDYAGTVATRLGPRIPGYQEAYLYPCGE